MKKESCAAVAQMAEHHPPKVGVAGSSPVCRSMPGEWILPAHAGAYLTKDSRKAERKGDAGGKDEDVGGGACPLRYTIRFLFTATRRGGGSACPPSRTFTWRYRLSVGHLLPKQVRRVRIPLPPPIVSGIRILPCKVWIVRNHCLGRPSGTMAYPV